MPSKSEKQRRFMEVIAHSPEFAKKAGVPQEVGKEFANADEAEATKRELKKRKASKMDTMYPSMKGNSKQVTPEGGV